MKLKQYAVKKIKNFIANPSDKTLSEIVLLRPQHCCFDYLMRRTSGCPKGCPGDDLLDIHLDNGDYVSYLCSLDRLKELWKMDQAKVVLYMIQLLACAESVIETNSESKE
jgi:hypothetical protein